MKQPSEYTSVFDIDMRIRDLERDTRIEIEALNRRRNYLLDQRIERERIEQESYRTWIRSELAKLTPVQLAGMVNIIHANEKNKIHAIRDMRVYIDEKIGIIALTGLKAALYIVDEIISQDHK